MIKRCRNCGSKSLNVVVSLGNLYPAGFIKPNESVTVKKLPLTLVQCNDCELVQLRDDFDPDQFYRQYFYKSSLNRSMVRDLLNVEQDIEKRVDLSGSVVIDIGANDGTLLSLFPIDTYRVGFDPALNLKEEVSKKCDLFINDYFNKEAYSLKRKAKSISAIACFYDVPDPNKFIKDVKSLLSKDGIFTVQFTDLYSMVTLNAFDSICHEHTMQYSFKVLKNVIERNGLEVFDCSRNQVNGGSIRVFAGFPSRHEINKNVNNLLTEEERYFNSCKENSLVEMMTRVEAEKQNLLEFLYTVNKHGKRTFISGASTKGMTLLQYYGIDNSLIPCALEVNPDKFGKVTLGTNIPIISEEEGLSMNPDYLVCLPWHFREGLLNKYENFIKNGGGVIFPLPHFEIVKK